MKGGKIRIRRPIPISGIVNGKVEFEFSGKNSPKENGKGGRLLCDGWLGLPKEDICSIGIFFDNMEPGTAK